MANPLSGERKSARYSQSRTDTMIGAGVRVAGNLTFTGVLRIQGDILGDVSCDADSSGTIVVGQSGNVTGTIKAPHIVVSGRVHGPAHSSESIEIHKGACFVGDTFYKEIEIHAGGVIEGSLIPKVSMDGDRLKQERFIQITEPSAVKKHGLPFANAVPAVSMFWERLGGGRKLGAAVILFIAVVTAVLVNRDPTPVTPPVADVALKADSSAKEAAAAQSEPVGSGGLQDGPRAVTGDATPLAPSPGLATKDVVQSSPPDHPGMDPERMVEVHGVNPGKPAGVFSVIGNEPSVLFRKKLGDPADGTRIDIPKGASMSIAIAKNEIFRVAQGRDIVIFYQGRKVAQKIIESGAWMRFVPQSSSEASNKK